MKSNIFTFVIIFNFLFISFSCVNSQDSNQLIKDFNSIVEAAGKDKKFSGAVMVSHNNKLIYEKAVGFQDLKGTDPNKIDTKFNVGSMNKMHTAVAVLQLVQQGKLKLNNTLLDVLPDYPNKSVASKVTIHNLLSHTSGFGDYLRKTMSAPADKYIEVNDYMPLITGDSLKFTPGERFSYSNAGFMVLGAVIEKISGKSYANYVQEHIYKPAGMLNTGFELYSNSSMKNMAIPLTRWSPGSNGQLSERFHPGKGGPAGGGYSTVGDWLKFGKALREYKLLDKKHYDLMTTGKNKMFGSKQYGYGCSEGDLYGIKGIGHNGGGPGINGEFTFYSNGYTFSVLGNLDFPSSTWIKRAFESLMLKKEGKLPKPSLKGNVTFELEGYQDAKVVSVLSSFNDSDPYKTIMKKVNGKWTCSVDLKPGEYAYCFVVDGRDVLDPANPEKTGRGPMPFSKLVVK